MALSCLISIALCTRRHFRREGECLMRGLLKIQCNNVLHRCQNFQMLSGSLITSKHILTSAECLLKNKDEIENQKNNKKVKPEYNKKECFYVIHGLMDKSSANTDRYLLPIKNHFVHGHAFTDVKEFNNNLGMYLNNLS